MFCVTIYVEGGPHDGETFACGPFEDAEAAADAERRLNPFGTTEVHLLQASPTTIVAKLS